MLIFTALILVISMLLKSAIFINIITYVNLPSFAACSITSCRDAFKASPVTVIDVWLRMFSVTVFVVAARLKNESGYLDNIK